jgi:hypothetical protein
VLQIGSSAWDPAKLQLWVTLAVGVVGFVAGNLVRPYFALRDRQTASRERKGDLAAVAIEHRHWERGLMRVPLRQDDQGWTDEADGIGFPMKVTNGSNES